MFSLLTLPLLAATALAVPLEERQAARGKFTFYPLPTALSGICDLTLGPDGAIWFEDILVNRIGRYDPKTHVITDYPIPFTVPGTNISSITIPNAAQQVVDRTALSCAIRNAADGNIYATDGTRNQLVRINPYTKKIDVYGPVDPTGNLFNFNDLYSAANGLYITQTTGNTFEFYSFKTQKFTTYNVPTPAAIPLGVFVASDKNVYIPELVGNKILVFNPSNGHIAEYPLPRPLQGPAVVRAQKGNYVYFSLFEGDGIGRINIISKKIDLFPSSQIGGLGGVTTGPSKAGGVFGTYFDADVISRLDTNTLKYTYIPFPATFATFDDSAGVLGDVPPEVDISAQYNGAENALYFGSFRRNALGRYALAPGE